MIYTIFKNAKINLRVNLYGNEIFEGLEDGQKTMQLLKWTHNYGLGMSDKTKKQLVRTRARAKLVTYKH